MIRLLPIACLAACSTLPVSDTDVEAAWVVLGEEGAAIARVITRASACPALVQDGVPLAMTVRAPAGTVALRKNHLKPSAFPVLACEASLGKSGRFATVAGRRLPLPVAQPRNIVVLGDTGCRMKSDSQFQDCGVASAWPFATLAAGAAATRPDLVVHLGDYHYRENECPAANGGCAASPWGYGWDAWKADFFAPAAPLLEAAPWVMVRGNHESCARAGQGWWRFLDPRSLEVGRDCNVDTDDAIGDHSAPYRVPLGGGAQIVVFDSSRAPGNGRWTRPDDPAIATFAAQFREASALAPDTDFSIFVMHHPVLAYAPISGPNPDNREAFPGNAALQQVMNAVTGTRLFPKGVGLSLSGHVHLFEAVGFSSDHPSHFVVGNGGTTLDAALPATLAMEPHGEARHDLLSSTAAFGFMTLERASGRWSLRSRDVTGRAVNGWTLQGGHLAPIAAP